MSRVYVSLIQSDFGRSHHGNFEAVIVAGEQLWHWSRDNSRDDFGPWVRGQRVTGDQDNVAGPGCIIQSASGLGRFGNFEVVVPLRHVTGDVELWHFYRDNSDARLPWIRGQRVTGDQDNVAGPGCIIESNLGPGQRSRLEVVVPLRHVTGDVELRHFYRDNSDAHRPWIRGQRVTGDQDNVAGPGCIIQSTSTTQRHGNFEVVVPLRQATGDVELRHFHRDNSDAHLPAELRQRLTMTLQVPWMRGQRVTGDHDKVAGPGCIIQSDFSTGPHGRFEVVVPLHLHNGSIELRHFFQDNSFRDNSDVHAPWTKAQFITQSGAGLGGIIQSSFSSAGHGNFEVIVDECRHAVVHYWHPNARLEESWIRTDCFSILEPHPLLTHRAQKIVQLTGEFDREGWDGTGKPKFALNRTESGFGIIGTDLGVSFAHQGRLYFLFGDTWRVGHGIPNDDLDAIAFCTDPNPDDGLELTFLPRPPFVPGIAQGAFDVPLDGVSWNNSMYVFFSTDRRQAGIYALMGRSILARSDNNGQDFTFLHEISRHKFINVSTTIVDAREHGLPGNGPQLVIFGSGRYRSSDVYLAVKPAANLEEPGGLLFYAGGLSQPRWSSDEDSAVPLFGAGCVGELSVRWNPLLDAWTCLYNADWPADRSSVGGIVMRWAKCPYGPWSEGDIAFSVNDGLGKFMHLPKVDHTQEGFGADRSADLAGMYGPYQIPQYTRRSNNGVQIYFTMSTWNPYQAVLMTLDIPTPLR